ncbi:TPM domain-containing protein [Sphingomonas sp. LT1P40]|uniref:TPM domain-containing protein n=1 Tax=Alteristakelama amylovorans TaxID=3096166 RepID=UPI002FCA68BF
MSEPVAPAQAKQLPALTGRVVDNADLLSANREALLTWALAETERNTKHQFVVVTVPTLGGRAIEAFGLALGNHWGIGRKGYDDGVLLIVAPNERKVRIEVGCGLEKTLTNAEASVIIEKTILPRIRAGNMAGGILAGSAAIIREIDTPGASS